MGKSVTATLLGILMREGVYKLDQPAPIPEWQKPGDPRAKIRISDLLHMSSGLRCRAPNDPDFDPAGPYPDHLFLSAYAVHLDHASGELTTHEPRRSCPFARRYRRVTARVQAGLARRED